MKYRTICVDPPWHYWNRATDRTHRGRLPYGSMAVDQICALDVVSVAAADAHLYLWTTNAHMREAHRIAEAWGFTQKTILTWIKTQIGLGDYFRNNTEHVLFCVRGRLPTLRNDCPTAFTAPRGRHSAKPQAFFDLVESASPGPYLEVFGRAMSRIGWTAIGNEVGDGGDIRDALARLREDAA